VLYGHPRTTKPESGHKVYPYLLRGAAITRPNQVLAMDQAEIPLIVLYRFPRPALFTPTSCSWLNAVEGFFAKLAKR
jgi:transposase